MTASLLQHEWVRYTITPVTITIGVDGEPAIEIDLADAVDADDNAAYGCKRCSLPLSEGINQLCTPTEETT